MFRTEVTTRRTGGGKIRAPKYLVNRGGALVGTEGGVAPSATHEGATNALKAGESTTHGTGRKHIDPTVSMDGSAPQRFGKRISCAGASKPMWNTHFNDRNAPARGQGGGSAVQEIQRRVEGKVGVKKFQSRRDSHGAFDMDAPPPASPPRNTTSGLTAEQRAVERLQRYATADPSLKTSVESLLKNGSAQELIRKENDLHKRQLRIEASEEYRQHQKPAPHKADRLPEPAEPNKAPFATTMEDNLKGHRGSQASKRKTYGAESLQEREARLDREASRQEMQSTRRHHSEHSGLPFDTADSGAPYPEPPAVGICVSKHGGRRPPHRSGADNRSTNFIVDVNEVSPPPSQHTSLRRNPCHNRHSVSVFEEPPTPALHTATKGNLRDAYEAKYTSINDRPSTGGKAHVRPAQTTSLW